MTGLPRYESWPPSPGGPAPYQPPQTPAYGYGAPSWAPRSAPRPAPRPGGGNTGTIVLIVLAAPLAPIVAVLLVGLVVGTGGLALLPAIPAALVMIAVCRPRRTGQNNRTTPPAPAPAGRPTRKNTPPLSHHEYKKG